MQAHIAVVDNSRVIDIISHLRSNKGTFVKGPKMSQVFQNSKIPFQLKGQ